MFLAILLNPSRYQVNNQEVLEDHFRYISQDDHLWSFPHVFQFVKRSSLECVKESVLSIHLVATRFRRILHSCLLPFTKSLLPFCSSERMWPNLMNQIRLHTSSLLEKKFVFLCYFLLMNRNVMIYWIKSADLPLSWIMLKLYEMTRFYRDWMKLTSIAVVIAMTFCQESP